MDHGLTNTESLWQPKVSNYLHSSCIVFLWCSRLIYRGYTPTLHNQLLGCYTKWLTNDHAWSHSEGSKALWSQLYKAIDLTHIHCLIATTPWMPGTSASVKENGNGNGRQNGKWSSKIYVRMYTLLSPTISWEHPGSLVVQNQPVWSFTLGCW